MATTIGAFVLDNDMIWTDEFQFLEQTGMSNRALDGHLVMQTGRQRGGRPITLTGEGDFGWQTRATVMSLRTLADSDPNATFNLILPDGRTFLVTFRHDEYPAVDFQPVARASAPGFYFWYYGTIKLLTVEGT